MDDSSDNQSSAASERETAWMQATQWLSRTLAAVLLMMLPAIGGSVLDKRFGTNFLVLIGLFLGLAAGTSALLVLAKRFTPQAGGKALDWDEESPYDSEQVLQNAGDGRNNHESPQKAPQKTQRENEDSSI